VTIKNVENAIERRFTVKWKGTWNN